MIGSKNLFTNPDQSNDLVNEHRDRLQLTAAQIKRWTGKRYPVLIGISNLESPEYFSIDKSLYGNIDDRLPVGDIQTLK